jgi:hypothetical protein
MSIKRTQKNFKLLTDAIILGKEFQEGTVIKTNGHIPMQHSVFEYTDDKADFVIELVNQESPRINEVIREKSKKEIAKEEADAKAKEDADAKALADAKAKEDADAKALADAKAKEDADAKALADAKAKEDADAKALADAKAKAQSAAKAK